MSSNRWHLVILFVFASCFARAGEQEVEFVRNGCPEALRKIQSAYENINVKGRLYINSKNKKPSSFVINYVQNGKERFLKLTSIESDVSVIVCEGMHDLFTIADSGDGWVLRMFGRDPAGKDSRIALQNYAGKYVSASHAVFGECLSSIIEHPTFRVLATSKSDNASRNLLRVEYEYRVFRDRPRWGLVDLDLDNFCSIVHHEARLGPNLPVWTVDIEYEETDDPLKLPTRMKQTYGDVSNTEFLFEKIERNYEADKKFFFTSHIMVFRDLAINRINHSSGESFSFYLRSP